MLDKMELSLKAGQIRKKLGADPASPLDIFALAQILPSLTLVFYPLGANISGFCFKAPSSSLIGLNSAMSLGRQRFTLAHEFYHLFFADQPSSIICSRNVSGNRENEKKADQFASYFLVPPAALYEAVQKRKGSTDRPLSLADFISLEQYFGISHHALLVRLAEEREIAPETLNSLPGGVSAAAARLGYDVSLYRPAPPDKQIQVLGHYIRQADRLLQRELISWGKYEELLLDAFRADLVYGSSDEGGVVID